jgi:hypothetical protein
MKRVRNLLEIYSMLEREGPERADIETSDLLRSAVVFLHATLEEFLRGIIREGVPHIGEQTLNTVPLVGQGRYPKKFHLGALAGHREKAVQQLIKESVDAYLDTLSFNSTTDIANWLEGLDIEGGLVNRRFSDLDQLMSRRHHIVHQADKGEGHLGAYPITPEELASWKDVVDEFVSSVVQALPGALPYSLRLF